MTTAGTLADAFAVVAHTVETLSALQKITNVTRILSKLALNDTILVASTLSHIMTNPNTSSLLPGKTPSALLAMGFDASIISDADAIAKAMKTLVATQDRVAGYTAALKAAANATEPLFIKLHRLTVIYDTLADNCDQLYTTQRLVNGYKVWAATVWLASAPFFKQSASYLRLLWAERATLADSQDTIETFYKALQDNGFSPRPPPPLAAALKEEEEEEEEEKD